MYNVHALAPEHRVYVVDLVGSGRSDKPDVEYSLEHFARFINGFMMTVGVPGASLVGHSLGGAIALEYAFHFPEKLDKLVLVAGGGLGREASLRFRLAALPFIGEWLTRPSRKGVASTLSERFQDPALISEDLIEKTYELAVLPGAHDSYLSTVRTLGSFRGLHRELVRHIRDNLHTIRVPTLIVWGRQDQILPPAQARAAKTRITNAQLSILDSCGHLPQLECAEAFNALVSEFLAI